MSTDSPRRWLTDEEQRAWRAYLVATSRLHEALDRQLQRDAGMPHAYYQILAMLSEAASESMRMSDLAEVLQISSSRLSHAVTRLEGLGWVRRDADAADRRVSHACLTPEGRAALEGAAPSHVATVAGLLFDQLTPEQVQQLFDISAAMLEVLAPDEVPGRILRPEHLDGTR